MGGISLRDAIATVGAGGLIVFDASLGNGTILLSNGALPVDKSVTINGELNNISIRAQTGHRVFFIDDGNALELANVTLSGLTIAGGSSTESGGGIYNKEALTVTKSTITGNTTMSSGGGIYNNEGLLNVTESTISGNTAESGGGIYNDDGVLNVAKSAISENTAIKGGGVFNYDRANITESTISGNAATRGAGLFNFYTANITNSTISGNVASTRGGGLFNGKSPNYAAGTLTVTNTTIAANLAQTQGNGIFNDVQGVAVLNNTIIAGGDGGNLVGTGTFSGTNNLVQDGIIPTGLANTITGDPMLGPLRDNGGVTQTHLLLSGSPALDTGKNSVAVDAMSNPLTADQRGRDRFVGTVDIGAVEMVKLAIAADIQSQTEGDSGTTSFTFTVTLSGSPSGKTTVDYAVVGSDVDADDFLGGVFPSGMVTFNQGETQKTIAIPVAGDTKVEASESFTVALSNPTSEAVIDAPAVDISDASSTILNDDSATLHLTGVDQAEGDGGGQTAFLFAVTLDHAVEGGFDLAFTTNDGTATTADNDYINNDSMVTFAGTAGEVQTITVQVNQDAKVEPDEVFNVALGAISLSDGGISPGRVTIVGGTRNGIIRNDDSAKLILASVLNISTQQLEGNDPGSAAQFQFSVTLDNPVPGGFTLRYLVRDGAINPAINPGKAELGKDYIVDDSAPYNQFSGGVGTLTFAGNANERLFLDLNAIGDTIVEADEFFNIELDTITLFDNTIESGLVTVSDERPGDRRQQGVILNHNLNGNGAAEDTSLLSLAFVGKFPSPNGPVARFQVTSSNAVQEGFQVDVVVDLVNGASSGLTFAASSSRGTANFSGDAGEGRTVDVPIPPSANMISAMLGNVLPSGAGVNAGDIIPGAPLTVTLPDNEILVAGPGPGSLPYVQVFKGSENIGFNAYDPGFKGGVRVATGDVTGDGVPDIITAAGPGGGPDVRVFDGATNGLMIAGPLRDFYAYPGNFIGGVYIAVADLDGDNRADIITGPGAGGGPNVRAFRASDGAMIMNFYAYPGNFPGGVRVAVADVNGDGTPDIITGPGPGGGPDVRVFDGTTNGKLIDGPLRDFYAYGNFTGGVYVAAADLDGDNRADIITGPGTGGGPNVRAFRASDGAMIENFYAYANFTGGVRVAAHDVDGDGTPDIVTSPGPGGGPNVRAFDGTKNGTMIAGNSGNFNVYNPEFTGGVYVAATDASAANFVDVIAEAGPRGANAAPLAQSDLPPLVDEAIREFEQAGLAVPGALADVHIQIVDLPGDELGEAIGNTILLDVDAAGFGWFIDPTPADDVEFQTGAPEVQGRVDLLTVITHELGHVIGLTHDKDHASFMSDRLPLGTRY